jgi:hypothetical protein
LIYAKRYMNSGRDGQPRRFARGLPSSYLGLDARREAGHHGRD